MKDLYELIQNGHIVPEQDEPPLPEDDTDVTVEADEEEHAFREPYWG